ncbi:MAG TPA: hypothetical protein VGV15_04165 [Terriglobales bacterium]|nr:hypothetical protein [Terriglobales bacterium]
MRVVRWHPELWRIFAVLFGVFVCFCAILVAEDGELDTSQPKNITPNEIIQRFTAKEKEWKQLREQYTFRQSVQFQAMNGDQVVGEYRQVADISYVQGKRVKAAVLAPQPSVVLSPEDVEDIETRASFTISSDELPQYNLLYMGQQRVDELHCYVFDIAPKQIEKDKRYFQGRIWVDDQDFQIVKNKGKSVPDIRIVKKKKVQENLFPQFTTWREQIDGQYWFPTFSSADDTLAFRTGDVRIKQVLKFTEYKKK